MANEIESNLKAHLKTLHRNLAESGPVDAELEMLLRQLDGDIRVVLARRAEELTETYGLASRAQEITARFAVKHPHLEPALVELGNMLANMGI